MQFQPPAVCRAANQQPRLPRATSSLALNACRDGASTASLGKGEHGQRGLSKGEMPAAHPSATDNEGVLMGLVGHQRTLITQSSDKTQHTSGSAAIPSQQLRNKRVPIARLVQKSFCAP